MDLEQVTNRLREEIAPLKERKMDLEKKKLALNAQVERLNRQKNILQNEEANLQRNMITTRKNEKDCKVKYKKSLVKYEELEKKIEKKIETNEEWVAFLSRYNTLVSGDCVGLVKLKVGEVKFTMYQQTLLKTGSPFFTALLNELFSRHEDEDGYIFVEADPVLFRYFVVYLQDDLDVSTVEENVLKNLIKMNERLMLTPVFAEELDRRLKEQRKEKLEKEIEELQIEHDNLLRRDAKMGYYSGRNPFICPEPRSYSVIVSKINDLELELKKL